MSPLPVSAIHEKITADVKPGDQIKLAGLKVIGYSNRLESYPAIVPPILFDPTTKKVLYPYHSMPEDEGAIGGTVDDYSAAEKLHKAGKETLFSEAQWFDAQPGHTLWIDGPPDAPMYQPKAEALQNLGLIWEKAIRSGWRCFSEEKFRAAAEYARIAIRADEINLRGYSLLVRAFRAQGRTGDANRVRQWAPDAGIEDGNLQRWLHDDAIATLKFDNP